MYSIAQRANSVFAFFVTVCLGIVVAVAAISPFVLENSRPPVEITLKDVVIKNGRYAYYHEPPPPLTEMAFLTFDLKADLRKLFNWNTKQLFIWLAIEYETESHDANQVVVWDDIVLAEEDALVDRKGIRAEYPMTDIGRSVKHINATVSLHWNVMPSVGILFSQSSHTSIPLQFSDYHGTASQGGGCSSSNGSESEGEEEDGEHEHGQEGYEEGEGEEVVVEYVDGEEEPAEE